MASPLPDQLTWTVDGGAVAFTWSDSAPVSFHGPALDSGPESTLLRPLPLAELFTATEQRGRTSQSYIGSAVGGRLRHLSSSTASTDTAHVAVIEQRDPLSLLLVTTTITKPIGISVFRFQHRVTNSGDLDVVLTAVASAVVGIGHSEDDLDQMTLVRGESEWLAEGRWHQGPLREVLPRLTLGIHDQDGRGRFAVTSHGAWSTGENIPVGVIADARTGTSTAWQIEPGAGWQWSIGQTLHGAFLSLTGPADLEHHFSHRLKPGASFDSVPAAIAVAVGGQDAALAELTDYRRFLRRPLRDADRNLPVVYNDFMNTLMGDPSTEKLLPLIRGAAAAGVEYFCVDAGWFAPAGDWWDTVGEWIEDPHRFTGGFKSVIGSIHESGMRAGTWLEPEVVGENSPAAKTLPTDAFFQRFGERVKEHGRYHLDFRHSAAIAHLNTVVDRLVLDYGISYLKLDYNINPGAGTEWQASSAGEGLLAHVRAFIHWMRAIQERHPQLLIENCSSGAMRMDYAYLADCHMQSTSDQQDFRLYPVIAASAPMTIAPEQCANWAYPDKSMDDEETVFTLVSGLAGRLYLSGFLDQLRPKQSEALAEAVALNKAWRDRLAASTPFWPMGLPAWDDKAMAVGFSCGGEQYIAVWSRSLEPAVIELPGVGGNLEQVFPSKELNLRPWSVTAGPSSTSLHTAGGYSARIYRALVQ